ncbi:unnamed protein product [Peronospora destructor]|uniref:FYVE-type domain-containing protein n=1 Tax=Peronospora destructor TaxID=86335 RepID=A0AAV0TER2_9STRA|nr:unnamed protein product [Peronospora destructor]
MFKILLQSRWKILTTCCERKLRVKVFLRSVELSSFFTCKLRRLFCFWGNGFPLPVDFFPPLHLSKSESTSFLQWGNSLLQETIDAYHREQFESQETRECKWKPIKHKRDLIVYKRRQLSDKKEYKYRCIGRIDGTLDEVVMGRYADNTADFRRISAIYREDIVDCAVLGVIKKRSSKDPFFLSCFKWMTAESLGKGLVKNRDVCCYEQMGMTRDCNGKEIGYTLTESVELPTCPLFNECIRAKFSVCYLYKRNKTGGVKVYMRGKTDAGGKVVNWVTDIKSAELWLRIGRATPVAHAVIATTLLKAGQNMERPFVTPGKCNVCYAKALGFLSSPKQCAVCRCLTCSSCVTKVHVLNFHDFRVSHHVLFCKKCVGLIHQVDLRAPENIRNPVEYAAAILAGPESSKITFSSLRPVSACMDNSSEGAEEGRVHHKASVTKSHSSRSNSSRSLRQPSDGGKHQSRDDEAFYFAQSEGSCSPVEHHGQATHNKHVKSDSSAIPAVTFDDERLLQKSSQSTDAYGRQHHHNPLPFCSANYQHFAGRDSEIPLSRSRANAWTNKGDVYSGSCDSVEAYDSSTLNSSAVLMTQIVQMNLSE